MNGTSPSLTCPSDRLLTVDGASAIVEFNAPIVVDNSNDDLTSSCTPPSGSSFPVGTTQVTCSAVDSDQNTETCTFDVTIQVTYSPDKLVSTDDGYQAIIVTDNEAPQLTCASSLSVTVVEDDLPSIITFNDPAVSDNSGETLQPTCSIPSGSSFNVGTTVVDCVAVDASGNQGSCSFDVIVEVDYSPVLTCPSTQIIPITNDAEEVIVDYTPAGVQDSEDPGLTATCQPPPSTLFPLGNTTVVCSAIDSMKNVGECQFDIIIKVDYPPNLTCGSNHESPTDDGTSTASVDFKLAYAHDKEDGELTAICQPPPSSLFHIGTSHVICSATDSVGNSEQCGFNITILDNEAPKLTCSSLVTLLTNPGEATATLLYDNALVTDNSGEVLQSECTPAVPGVLGIGTHSGSCFAIDSSNNQGTCDFPIEVKDEEDPEIVCPDSITVEAPESAISTTVNFDLPTVHDNSATNIIPTCSSESGMNFSIGVTKIDCFATDSSNNENECTFDITVTSSGSIEVPAIGGCDDKEDYYFGSIQSENYPGPYERNTNCQWQIDVPDGHFAYMWFERTVDIEAYISNQIYCYDYITIKTFKRNFINIRVSVENHYCAQQLPEDISTNDDIIIYFTSDDTYQWTGFSLKYKVQPTEPPAWDSWSDWSECSATCGSGYKTRHRACSTSDCIGHSTQDLSCDLNKCTNGCEPGMGHTLIEGVGQILSPGYPFQYPKSYFISRSSPCSVTVDVPVGKSVTFYFDDLDLTSSTFCFFDYLEFSSPDKKYILCGNDKSVQVPTFTKGPVEVIFRTDSALLYNTFSRGFDMKYIFN
ncbi:hyalin-like [Antedon mediterranea]|uniref:hyalin-like n=1 Tax=Antedon mediterranea TaxID=105859 RepID=UPI003AF90565